MANSIPKSGTHMLMRLLSLLGFYKSTLFIVPPVVDHRVPTTERLLRMTMRDADNINIGAGSFAEINRTWLKWRLRFVRKGAFFGGHCVYTPELDRLLSRNQVKMVGIIRDPRDVAVSYMHYVQQSEGHHFHEGYKTMRGDYERLMFSIRGGKVGGHVLYPLGETYREFLKWQSQQGAFVIRFEDLVGERGGGTSGQQQELIESVGGYLGLNLRSHETSSIQNNLFGVGGTFRKGQIGGWKNELSKEHEIAIEQEFGYLLTELGYEY